MRFLTKGPFDFELAPGQAIGISGTSGVGKSLFLRALADIIPWQGQMHYGGAPCHGVTPVQWRRTVSLVPAEPVWWHQLVGGHFDESTHKTDELTAFLGQLGFETGVLQWEVSRLSSGEKQRLALLRALIQQPKVLLLDEPTANLDNFYTEAVETLLSQYHELNNTAMLMVSHDIEQLHRCTDKQLRMQQSSLEPMAG